MRNVGSCSFWSRTIYKCRWLRLYIKGNQSKKTCAVQNHIHDRLSVGKVVCIIHIFLLKTSIFYPLYASSLQRFSFLRHKARRRWHEALDYAPPPSENPSLCRGNMWPRNVKYHRSDLVLCSKSNIFLRMIYFNFSLDMVKARSSGDVNLLLSHE